MKAAFPTLVVLFVGFLSGATGCSKKETPAPVIVSHAKPDPPKPTPNVDLTDGTKSDVDFPVDEKGPTPVDSDDYWRGINKYANTIRRQPWDQQAIVDFASWLEGNDKPRARLVRLQLQLSQLPYDDPRKRDLNQEVQELIGKHQARWTKPLRSLTDKATVGLEVGLIDSIELKDAEDNDLALLEATSELRVLRLLSPKLTGVGFERISRLPNLDSLTIEGKQAIAKESLAQLEKLPPRTVIRLYVDNLDRNAVRTMNARRIGKLERLSADEKHSAGVRFLRAMPDYPLAYGKPLAWADLRQSGVEDAQMQLLAHVPELEAVYISESDVTAKGIAHLHGLKNLKDLGLWQTNVESIAALAGLTKLEKLGIFPEYGIKMGDAGLEGLQNFTNLQDLYLNDKAISDETVKRLAALTRLRKLELTVSELKSDEALATLSRLVELQWLDFRGGRISDGALKHLAGLKQLELLSITVSSGTGAGFRHLSGLEKLKYLHVSGAGVTDEGIDQLRGMKNLESIMAQGSAVSVSGAERLAARLPHVTIILDKNVIKSPRESHKFRRQRFNNSVSVLLPIEWTHDQMASMQSTLMVRENGWEKIGSWSGGVVGPAQVVIYDDDHSVSAKAALMACVNNNAHLHPKVLKNDVQPIAGSKENASCIYRNDHGQHLVCTAKIGGKFIVLDCEAPVARFLEFENLFMFVAKSIRISDDGRQHAEETVNVPADSLKLK